jgi:beta-galactosidase
LRHYYGAAKSADLKTWEDVSTQMKFPAGHRHGTVLRVTREVLEKLKAQ